MDNHENNEHTDAPKCDYYNNGHSSMSNHSNSHPGKESHPLSLTSQIREYNFYKTLESSSSQDNTINLMDSFLQSNQMSSVFVP